MGLVVLFLGSTQLPQSKGGTSLPASGWAYGQICRTWTSSRGGGPQKRSQPQCFHWEQVHEGSHVFHSAVLDRASQQFLIYFDIAKVKASHKYSHLVETKLNCFFAVLYMTVLRFTIEERLNNCCLLFYVAFSLTEFPLTWHILHKIAELSEIWNMAKYHFVVKWETEICKIHTQISKLCAA